MIRPVVSQLPLASSVLPNIIFGIKRYIEYQRGTLNVILSCPHDGNLEPAHIPDREDGFVLEEEGHFSHQPCSRSVPVKQSTKYPLTICKELFTLDLTVNLANELELLVGKRPHVIICHLHRKKLDTNRSVGEATFGVPDAVRAYNEFHKFICQAKQDISGPGLFIDMHGHRHFEGWIELGYLLPKLTLNSGDLLPEESSMRALARRKLAEDPEITFKDLISGHLSLGCLLEQEGYRALPSPKFCCPGNGKYFRGGYTTRTHGSLFGGLVDAIQIESPSFLCDTEQSVLYTKALARSIKTFLEMHY